MPLTGSAPTLGRPVDMPWKTLWKNLCKNIVFAVYMLRSGCGKGSTKAVENPVTPQFETSQGSEAQGSGAYVLQILGRVLITIVAPLYGGYIGASADTLFIYILLAGAWSLWAYGQPGPQQLWQTAGWIGVLKGWIVMSAAVLIVAGPAFAIGYFVLRTSG
jgi:hypothetical protein